MMQSIANGFPSHSVAIAPFRKEFSLEKRTSESRRIRSKYPDRIPVIVEKDYTSDIPDIDKKKYLVPSDLTVGQFVYVIRKRIKLQPEKAIFVFISDENILPPTAALMSSMYDSNRDRDGFLYIKYTGENTFGGNNRNSKRTERKKRRHQERVHNRKMEELYINAKIDRDTVSGQALEPLSDPVRNVPSVGTGSWIFSFFSRRFFTQA